MKASPYKLISLLLLFFLLCSSCASVATYERQFVSDPEMQMNNDPGKEFNNYVFSIREGATPSGTGKASGGCGCN